MKIRVNHRKPRGDRKWKTQRLFAGTAMQRTGAGGRTALEPKWGNGHSNNQNR